jgi:peptidyl-prolyl cis-trans isomerase C
MELTKTCLLFLSLSLAVALAGCSSGKQELPPDAAAMVNDSAITKNELEVSLGSMLQQYKAFGMKMDSTQVDSLRSKVLESLISRELIFQEAQKAGLTVSEEDLSKEIASISRQYPNEEAFKQAMTSQGITEETLKKQFTRNIAIRNFVEGEVAKKQAVSAEEKTKYYEEHKEEYKHAEQIGAKHILVTVQENEPADSVAKKQAKIEGLLARVKAGEDFSALAREYSDCPSAPEGGDLGYFSQGRMVKPFEEAAFSLKDGEVSNVVKTVYGFHIIQVYGRKPAGSDSYEEAEKSIDELMRKDQTNKDMEALIKELKSKADIVRGA